MLGFLSNLFNRKPKDRLPLVTTRPWKPGEREMMEANQAVERAWMYRKEYQQPLNVEARTDGR